SREAALEFAPQQPVPVFPLPDFVLFPRAVVPLHVFELRYRALVRDALRGERLIALALLAPGWERDYHGSPAFHSTRCRARLYEALWRPDDCYDLRVTGLARIHLGRVLQEHPYRVSAVSPWPQRPFSDSDPLVELERRALAEAYGRLQSAHQRPELDAALPLEVLVNTVCTELAIDQSRKLAWLELDDVVERARQVREHIERSLRRPRPRQGGEHN